MAHNFLSIVHTFNLVNTGDSTLINIGAASNIPVVIEDIWIALDGQSNTEKGVRFWIIKQSDGGAGATNLKPNVVPLDDRITHTVQASVSGAPFGTQPAVAGLSPKWQFRFHPQSGVWLPPKMDRKIVVPSGGFIGVMYNAPDSHLCDLTVQFEE